MEIDRTIFHPDYKQEPYWWEAARPGTKFAVDLPKEMEIFIIGSGYSASPPHSSWREKDATCPWSTRSHSVKPPAAGTAAASALGSISVKGYRAGRAKRTVRRVY